MKHTTATVQPATTRILLIRHGHVGNPRSILYGRLPGFRLSALGRLQARCTGRRLRDLPLAAVVSSPLLRCRQTAHEILALHPGLRLLISQRITEVLTVYEGMPGQTVDRLHGDIYTSAPAGFEQPWDIVRRTRGFLADARRRYPGRCVAAVTHGDIIAFTVLWAKGWALTPRNKQRLADVGIAGGYPGHASVTVLSYATKEPDERPQVSHLPFSDEDDPLTV